MPVAEEEQLVFLDRPAEGRAVLIPPLARRRQVVEIVGPLVGIKEVVAQIFKSAAMVLVGA